jgi:hypothetical protein
MSELSTRTPLLPPRRPMWVSLNARKVRAAGNILGKRPSPPRNASCRPQPWPRRAYAASQTEPSTSRRAACRPHLNWVRYSRVRGSMKVDSPNLMPGLSSRTFSRCSLAKNMYADRPRLGALGSSQELALSRNQHNTHERLTLLLLSAIGLGGLALAAGYLLLRHDVGYM